VDVLGFGLGSDWCIGLLVDLALAGVGILGMLVDLVLLGRLGMGLVLAALVGCLGMTFFFINIICCFVT
jgi:hypothetical protein